MTIEEAKQRLQAYRWYDGAEDAADPFFDEALKLARENSELGEWFAQQQAFDKAMSSALQTMTPPAGLRESLLLSAKRRSPSNRSNHFWFSRQLLALAAALVLLLGGAAWYSGLFAPLRPGSALTMESFAKQVLDLRDQGQISLGKSGSDPDQLRVWLAEQGAPAQFVLPRGLDRLPSHGCQTYRIGGAKVAFICFPIEGGQVAYLFIVDQSSLKGVSPLESPSFHATSGGAYATWSAGGKSYVLTGDNLSEETLHKLI